MIKPLSQVYKYTVYCNGPNGQCEIGTDKLVFARAMYDIECKRIPEVWHYVALKQGSVAKVCRTKRII